ncbi:hypothetical protein HY772_01895 [Candidatus Woesearchaeota archaeon]|nr:hypothetical protein [Candidatus Woesearchaeota archaeon]
MVSNFSLQLNEAKRIWQHSRKVAREGYHQYQGDAVQICETIIQDCWNGTSFTVSSGHFRQFYCRDIGWCAPSLIELGYKKELKATLAYALERFATAGKVTVALTPDGKAFNFPNFASVDSLAYLLRSLRLTNADDLVEQYRRFLDSQIAAFFKKTIDSQTGLLRKDMHFSAMKDHALRKSSTYDNVMLAVLAQEVKTLGLDNPFVWYDYPKMIKRAFWSGAYFYDDLQKLPVVTGDSNVIPFWTGIIDDDTMLRAAIASLQNEGLDRPFPLRYVAAPTKKLKMVAAEFFVPNWEQNSIWSMMGMMYVEVLEKIDRKKAVQHLDMYKRVIEENRNFLELYTRYGKPYNSWFYSADEGMLWACMFLSLSRRFNALKFHRS